MDVIIPGFAAASLIAALVSGVLTWRVLHRERRRSAARVAALAAAIDASPDLTESGHAPYPAAGTAMFATVHPVVAHGHPLVKLGVGFIAAMAAIVLIAMSADRGPAAPTTARSTADALELISMRHARNDDSLTVTGLVRNPREVAASGIIAVVFAFDRNGGFITSGRAPLDFDNLAPGDESPFQVTVPNAGDVARYRVSFRSEHGVVRHLDRRPAGATPQRSTVTRDMANGVERQVAAN